MVSHYSNLNACGLYLYKDTILIEVLASGEQTLLIEFFALLTDNEAVSRFFNLFGVTLTGTGCKDIYHRYMFWRFLLALVFYAKLIRILLSFIQSKRISVNQLQIYKRFIKNLIWVSFTTMFSVRLKLHEL